MVLSSSRSGSFAPSEFGSASHYSESVSGTPIPETPEWLAEYTGGRFPILRYIKTCGLPELSALGKPTLQECKAKDWAYQWPKYRGLERDKGTRELNLVRRIQAWETIVKVRDALAPFAPLRIAHDPPLEGEPQNLHLHLPAANLSVFDLEDILFLQGLRNEDELLVAFKKYVLDTASEAWRFMLRYPLYSPIAKSLHFKPMNRLCPAHHARWDIFVLPPDGIDEIPVVLIFIPPWELGLSDFQQLVAEQFFTNNELDTLTTKTHIASDTIWALVYEILHTKGHKFIVTNYVYWAFGAFSADWRTAAITDVHEAGPRSPFVSNYKYRASLTWDIDSLTPLSAPLEVIMADIITHTPEDVLRWKKIARTDPDRVARTLALPFMQATKEGDHLGFTFPALQAVREILLEERPAGSAGKGESKAWVKLVSAGIADALCKNACQMVPFFDALPVNKMPPGILEKVKQETRAPYYGPLEILYNASLRFHNPPTKTDKKIIAALEQNWSRMMDRIWNKPEATLRTEDSHVAERIVLAQLLSRTVTADPSFISILYEPSDLTIQIIARHWKHAQKAEDILYTASTLGTILKPDHPRQIAYVRNSGLECLRSQIVSKILVGVGPTALSTKPQQVKALIATFAEHLVRVTGHSAAIELYFLEAVALTSKKDPSDIEIAKALLKAGPLWSAMFRLMKKSGKLELNEKTDGLNIISATVRMSRSTLHGATLRHRSECEPLVRIWANENLFGALEETVELLVKMPGMTMHLTTLAKCIDTTVSEGSPSLRRLLRAQFPRWRLIGTLIRHDIARQQKIGPVSIPLDDSIPSLNSGIWDHGAWQCFATLQFQCTDPTACGKRGCGKAGKISCQCKVVKYCSGACRSKDAKDHQRICGQMAVLETIRRDSTNGPMKEAAASRSSDEKYAVIEAAVFAKVKQGIRPGIQILFVIALVLVVAYLPSSVF